MGEKSLYVYLDGSIDPGTIQGIAKFKTLAVFNEISHNIYYCIVTVLY